MINSFLLLREFGGAEPVQERRKKEKKRGTRLEKRAAVSIVGIYEATN